MISQTGLSPQYQKWKTHRLLKEKSPCACGCGKLATYGNKFIHGHYNKIRFPFDKAREIARSLNLNSEIGYRKLKRQGKLPKELPGHPDRAYKNRGWISWYDFLGNEQIKLLPFEKAKEIVLTLSIGSKSKYLKLYREKKLPRGLPNDPYDAYINRGWTSWPDFLGNEPPIKPLPFEDARRIARSLGCRTREEYQRLLKQDKLPKGMPRSPSDAYKNKGWVDWYDFLGNEPPTRPLPFKEAIRIVRKLGIRSKEEYQRLYKEGKLPKGLPYDPSDAYAKEKMDK